jgi:molybdopterin-guanine dinucleotide biosynthesis protein A
LSIPGATAAAEPDAIGFVLAGGRSSRMGADKALVLLDGRPLVAHSLGILREVGLETSIAGGESTLASFAPLVEDRRSGLGPLSGICTALASTPARWSVFTSVDLPLLPSSLVTALLCHARISGRAVTAASINGFAQTFPVVLERSILPVLERELGAGRGGCFAAFQAAASSRGEPLAGLPVEALVQCGQVAHPQGLPAARWFLNVNTPEDLRRAHLHRQAPIA